MELGSWSIINLLGGGPSLLGLIPLVLFIILCMAWAKAPILACAVPAFIGLLMCGQSVTGMGGAIMSSVSGFMGQVAVAVMLGSGLSKLLQTTGVTNCICHWLVKRFKVNTEKKGLLIIMVVLLAAAFAIGSNMTSAIIAAPLLIPIAAACGINPAILGICLLIFCMCGAELSPFFSSNIVAMEITGLSYGKLMLFSVLPFVLVTAGSCYFICLWLNKKMNKIENRERYDQVEDVTSDSVEFSAVTKRTTIAFLVIFFAGVIYMIKFGGGFAFVYFYILMLSVVVSVFAKLNASEACNLFATGAASTFSIYLLLVFSDVMLATVTAMGGFEALAAALTSLVGDVFNQSILLMIASLFGIFGLNGTAAQQMVIMEELFHPMYVPLGLHMGLWSMALIFGSLVSNFLFPGGMHINLLGMAKSKDMKTMMKGTWIVCAVETVFAVVYSLVMPLFF